jgi:tetratricopeptide (TPR) repeat protein
MSISQKTIALAIMACIFFVIDPSTARSQTAVSKDTFAIVRQLRSQSQYINAIQVLSAYQAAHPKDVNALWLLAQTESWLYRYEDAKKHYELAVHLQPKNDYLVLDYAKSLLNMGEWQHAVELVQPLEKKQYADVFIIKAKVFYWTGEYAKAYTNIQQAIHTDSQKPEAYTLQTQIQQSLALWMKLGVAYSADDQPLQSVTTSVEAGKFISPVIAPHIQVTVPVFMENAKTVSAKWLRIGNTSSIYSSGTSLDWSAGIIEYPFQNKTDWTGEINIKQTISKSLSLSIAAAHEPYFYTLSSIDTIITTNHFNAALNWTDTKHKWVAQIATVFNSFADNNYTYSIYGWAYAPAIHFSSGELKLGYSFNYSDSKESRYVAKQTVAEILASPSKTVDGIYHPYFTPSQQQIHAALAWLSLHTSNKTEFGVKASIAVYATLQSPTLSLSSNSSNATINKTYYLENYTPYNVNVYFKAVVSDKLSLTIQYEHNSTYFYSTNYAGISIRKSFYK